MIPIVCRSLQIANEVQCIRLVKRVYKLRAVFSDGQSVRFIAIGALRVECTSGAWRVASMMYLGRTDLSVGSRVGS